MRKATAGAAAADTEECSVQAVAIVDYGLGNLPSVQKGLERMGVPARITADPADLTAAPAVVLPGVGAFPRAMANLQAAGFVEPLLAAARAGKPLLGICLGMQLLLSMSEEWQETPGLGLIPGRVRRLPPGVKLPHIGWNQVEVVAAAPALFAGLPARFYAYFVHSYAVAPDDPAHTAAVTTYGSTFTVAVRRDNIMGTQFHPEKSSRVGLKILENFGKAVQAFARR